MSKTDLDQRMATLAAGRPAAPPPPVTGAPRTKRVTTGRVKVAVALDPVEHRYLRQLCLDTCEQLGLHEVAAAEFFRVLLGLTKDDHTLVERVWDVMAQTGGTRRRYADRDH